ncbi:MAG: hypothetical protein LBJ42_00565, partial [Holosporales bacterium]|nr:hypothetical protein [Holosporales bacterium]
MWGGSEIHGGLRFAAFGCAFIVLVILFSVTDIGRRDYGDNVVNVCGWYGIVSRSVLRKFEKETG